MSGGGRLRARLTALSALKAIYYTYIYIHIVIHARAPRPSSRSTFTSPCALRLYCVYKIFIHLASDSFLITISRQTPHPAHPSSSSSSAPRQTPIPRAALFSPSLSSLLPLARPRRHPSRRPKSHRARRVWFCQHHKELTIPRDVRFSETALDKSQCFFNSITRYFETSSYVRCSPLYARKLHVSRTVYDNSSTLGHPGGGGRSKTISAVIVNDCRRVRTTASFARRTRGVIVPAGSSCSAFARGLTTCSQSRTTTAWAEEKKKRKL